MKTAKEPRARVINEAQETVLASEIKTHPRNPRRGKVEAISESIHANGFYGALVVNQRTKHILAGNHRFLAGKDLGMTSFPVIWVDVDRAEEERILAADNRTSDLGGYDNEALAALLEGLRGTDEGLSGTGYDDADLAALLEGLADEALDGEAQEDPGAKVDRAAELAVKWGTARGQVWQAGEHRLMCGDSASKEDVAVLLGGCTLDLLVTDPPYGVSYADKNDFLGAIGKANNIEKEIENDHLSIDETGALWRAVFGLFVENAKKGAVYYMTGPHLGDLALMMLDSVRQSGLLLKHVLVWVKNNFVLARTDYHYKHEAILYGWKPGAGHYYGGESNETSVWEYNKPHKSDMHPTTKPVELFARMIKNGSRAGETVYDPFMGSGTTAVACQQLGRRAFGMEISPDYLAVQLERLSEMGLTPRKIRG